MSEQDIRNELMHYCTVLDMMDVFDDLYKFIQDSQYDVRCLGFDPYNAKEFIARWTTENSSFGVEKKSSKE